MQYDLDDKTPWRATGIANTLIQSIHPKYNKYEVHKTHKMLEMSALLVIMGKIAGACNLCFLK